MILAFIAIILTLILVVGIHEAGHAVAAAYFKVKIKRISLGFGKPLATHTDKTGCEWVWALWPLGGYVQLLNSRIEKVLEKDFAHCFDKKSVWQRCIILIAGPLANFLMAFLAFTFMFMLGYQQQTPFIQKVSPNSQAALAGIQANERFLAIAGQATNSWQEVGMELIMALGKSQVPVILGNNQGGSRKINLNLTQWHYTKEDKSLLTSLGIKAASGKLYTLFVPGQSLLNSAHSALAQIVYLLKFFLIMLKQLLTHTIPFSVLLGPLGLFSASISSFLQGIAVFLYFIASFSLVVGLINLFPIPGLDGCSIIYALVEKIRAKPVTVAFEILLYQFALIFFALLLIQLLMNDLQRFLK